jgi:hypothetical protein
MIHLTTNTDRIQAENLRDGDWVIGDLGDQQVLLRYQDSLVKMTFRPVLMDSELLELLGFGSEADVYELDHIHVSVVNRREFIFESGAKGRIPFSYLHQLQQTWRQFTGEELVADVLEQPHEIEDFKD